jgi:YbbR domain-containing protein
MASKGFRHHLGLKLISIVLAALMWLLVSGEQIVERARRIPLEFTNLPAELEIVGDPPDVVDVRLRGSSGALSRMPADELVAVLDLRAARPGRRLFHLTTTDVRTPFGVDVVQVNPASVPMTFEASSTKVVPVVPSIEGDPAPGYAVGTVTAEPSTVEVVGATTAVRLLTEAITEPVSVAGATAPVNESVTIGVPDPSVRLRTPQSARVSVSVSPAPVEWSISQVPVTAKGAAGVVQISPRHVMIQVRGPRELTGSAVAGFEVSVDVEGLRPGQFVLPVHVVAPPRIGVVKIQPEHVRVRVR